MLSRCLGLATDLYELTMAAAYWNEAASMVATFELFIRDLPPNRNYLVAAGLEPALAYLEEFHFTADELAYVRQHPVFRGVRRDFFDYLGALQFSGEVWAVPEGTPVFANEPLLRVTAPIIEAQLVETFLLTTLNFQTMVASKASRVVHAAAGRDVIEFGSRRAHGSEAGMYAARAAYLAGCAGTSNVEAGLRFGVPTSGTMAHSLVMAFDDERRAFQSYARAFPDSATLLIDTYDTVEGARRIVAAGLHPRAVRLDSGDLAALSHSVRQVLNEGGLSDTRIFASGDLDEWAIATVLEKRAPIDAFGVGTRLATSADAPALEGVYKLVEVTTDHQSRGTLKLSPGKATFPGRKQVWRLCGSGGDYRSDVIGRAEEASLADSEPLLTCVMRGGRRMASSPPLPHVRERCGALVAHLPAALRQLEASERYPVMFSQQLRNDRDRLVSGPIRR